MKWSYIPCENVDTHALHGNFLVICEKYSAQLALNFTIPDKICKQQFSIYIDAKCYTMNKNFGNDNYSINSMPLSNFSMDQIIILLYKWFRFQEEESKILMHLLKYDKYVALEKSTGVRFDNLQNWVFINKSQILYEGSYIILQDDAIDSEPYCQHKSFLCDTVCIPDLYKCDCRIKHLDCRNGFKISVGKYESHVIKQIQSSYCEGHIVKNVQANSPFWSNRTSVMSLETSIINDTSNYLHLKQCIRSMIQEN